MFFPTNILASTDCKFLKLLTGMCVIIVHNLQQRHSLQHCIQHSTEQFG